MNTILTTPHFFRLKAAVADLVTRAGGIERAGAICGYSKTHVARFAGRDHADIMPLAAVLALEIETGAPLVTRAMAAIHGLDTTPTSTGSSDHLLGAYVAVAQSSAELAADVATAVADGKMTPNELTALDHRAAKLDQNVEGMREAIASSHGKVVTLTG